MFSIHLIFLENLQLSSLRGRSQAQRVHRREHVYNNLPEQRDTAKDGRDKDERILVERNGRGKGRGTSCLPNRHLSNSVHHHPLGRVALVPQDVNVQTSHGNPQRSLPHLAHVEPSCKPGGILARVQEGRHDLESSIRSVISVSSSISSRCRRERERTGSTYDSLSSNFDK